MNLYQRILQWASPPLDFYQRGWIKVTNDSVFGRGVVATELMYVPTHHKVLIGRLKGCLITNDMLTSAPPSVVNAYSITVDPGDLLVLMTTHWSSKMNHTCAEKANVQVEDDNIYLIKSVNKGEELRWDYGFDYICFMLTHKDTQAWEAEYPFILPHLEYIYKYEDDYSYLFQLQLYNYESFSKMTKELKHYVKMHKVFKKST